MKQIIKTIAVIAPLALAGWAYADTTVNVSPSSGTTGGGTQVIVPPSNQQPAGQTSGTAGQTQPNPSQGNSISTGAPVQWTELEGEVTHVNQEQNILEMRLKGTNNVVSVPITPQVSIYRHGDHKYNLKDINPGDSVKLKNEGH